MKTASSSGLRIGQLAVVRQRGKQCLLKGVLASSATQPRYAETQQRTSVAVGFSSVVGDI